MKWLARRFLWLLGVLLVLVLAGFLAIPALLSSDWGRERLERSLTANLGRPVRVSNLDFSWGAGLTVSGFALGPEGDPALTTRLLRAKPELLSLLGDEMRLRRIEVEGVDLLVIRREDGSFSVPAMEKLAKEEESRPRPAKKAPKGGREKKPAEEKGDSRIASLSVVLAARDVSILVRDAGGADLHRFDGFEAEVTLAAGEESVPVRLRSEPEGIDLVIDLRLFEAGRVSEHPAFRGTLELAVADLGRYEKLAGREGLAGAAEGKITLFGVAGGRVEGEADLQLGGAKVRVTEFWAEKKDAHALLTVRGETAGLRRSLPFLDLPDELPETLDADIALDLVGDAWTATIATASIAAGADRPLLAALPGLGTTARFTGKIAGDRDLAELRLVEPLVVRLGETTIQVEGSVARPRGDDLEGELRFRVEGPLTKPDLESLREASVAGRVKGELRLSLAGDVARLSGEVTVNDLLVAKPGIPEVAEKRLALFADLEYAIGEGALVPRRLEVQGAGVFAAVTGKLTGLPDAVRGELGAELVGDLARVRPFLPTNSSLSPEGAYELKLGVDFNEGLVRVLADGVIRDLVLKEGLADRAAELHLRAEVFPGEDRVKIEKMVVMTAPARVEIEGTLKRTDGELLFDGSLSAAGDLGRIPRSLLPEGLEPTGTFTTDLSLGIAGERLSAKGRTGFTALSLGNRFQSPKSELRIDASAEGGDRIDIREAVFTSTPVNVTVSGRLEREGEGAYVFAGRAQADGDFENIPRELLPEGLSARGRFRAEADLSGGRTGTVSIDASDVEVRGLSGVDGPVRARSLSFVSRVTREVGEVPSFSDGTLTLPAGKLSFTGTVHPRGRSDARLVVDLDVAGLFEIVPGLLPEGLAAAGRLGASLELAGDLRETDPLDALSGRTTVKIDKATWPGYELTEGLVTATLGGRRLEIEGGDATLNGGPVSIEGSVDLSEEVPVYDLTLKAKAVSLAQRMESEARYLAPIFGSASELSGLLTVNVKLSGEGKGREDLLDSLTGSTRLEVAEGAVRGSPLLAAVLGFLGQGTDLRFRTISGDLTFAEGRVLTDNLVLAGPGVDLKFAGYTGFDGKIRYKLGVKLPEGAEKRNRWIRMLDKDGYIPLVLKGTISSPKLKPPDAKDLVGSFLEDLLRGARDKAKEKDEKKMDKKKRRRRGEGGGGKKKGGTRD